jgi:hypothetical protein
MNERQSLILLYLLVSISIVSCSYSNEVLENEIKIHDSNLNSLSINQQDSIIKIQAMKNVKEKKVVNNLIFTQIVGLLNLRIQSVNIEILLGENDYFLGYRIYDKKYTSPEGLKIGDSYSKLKLKSDTSILIGYYNYESMCCKLPCGLVAKFYGNGAPYNSDWTISDTMKIRCFERSEIAENILKYQK